MICLFRDRGCEALFNLTINSWLGADMFVFYQKIKRSLIGMFMKKYLAIGTKRNFLL